MNKNVLIITDLEGISGVASIDAMKEKTELNDEACKNLMHDANSASKALFDAGANKVYVCDGHHSGQNFLNEMRDKRVIPVSLLDLSWVIKEVSSIVLIGMHAMAGTINGFLTHTQDSSCIHRYLYNGERIGEMMQASVFGGYFNVPCIMMSGDETACEEAKRFFPDIYVAPVKKALSRNLAECYPLEIARKNIYDACYNGFINRDKIKPYPSKLPLVIDVEYNREDFADRVCLGNKNAIRVDEYTVREIKEKVEGYLDVLLI